MDLHQLERKRSSYESCSRSTACAWPLTALCNSARQPLIKMSCGSEAVSVYEDFLVVLLTSLDGHLFAHIIGKRLRVKLNVELFKILSSDGQKGIRNLRRKYVLWIQRLEKGRGLIWRDVDCRKSEEEEKWRIELVVREIGNNGEITAMRSRPKYKFKERSQSITYIHYDVELNHDWQWQVVQINVTKIWKWFKKYN